MSIEAKILAAFPGKENSSLRVALYSIAWAFEAIEGEDESAGRAMLRVLRDAKLTGAEMGYLRQNALELCQRFLKAAALLDDAARRIEIAQLDAGLENRGV